MKVWDTVFGVLQLLFQTWLHHNFRSDSTEPPIQFWGLKWLNTSHYAKRLDTNIHSL